MGLAATGIQQGQAVCQAINVHASSTEQPIAPGTGDNSCGPSIGATEDSRVEPVGTT